MLVSVFFSAITFLRSAAGIFLNASLVGAKTVIAGAVFSESTRPASLTAETSVDSTGLFDAAVATGSWAMPAKLPGSDESVGTAAQPAPKFIIEVDMLGAALVAIGAAVSVVV